MTVRSKPTAMDPRAIAGPGGREGARHFAGPGLGCGLGAACAREDSWAEPVSARLGPRRAEMKEGRNKFSYYFSRAILMHIFYEFE